MSLGRLNHIGVVTASMDGSIAFWREIGAEVITDPFDMPEQGVRVAFVDTPDAHGKLSGTQIELIEPLPGSTIASWLEKNPAGGQHHLCFEVPDIHAAKAELEGMGKRILGEPRTGAHGTPIFFVHPRDMQGILTEFMETPKGGH